MEMLWLTLKYVLTGHMARRTEKYQEICWVTETNLQAEICLQNITRMEKRPYSVSKYKHTHTHTHTHAHMHICAHLQLREQVYFSSV